MNRLLYSCINVLMGSNKKELATQPIKWLVIIGKLIKTLKITTKWLIYTLPCDFTALKGTCSRFSFAY